MNPLPKPGANPIVTVVMANYNGARYIEAALRSALAQSLSDIEVIVADDASTDDSADRVVAIAARDSRVRLLRAPSNGGPAAARNLCLDDARGRWIAIMDADDLMHPERLERLVAAAETDGTEIIADDLLIFDDNSTAAPTTCLSDRSAAAAFWVDTADYVRGNILFGGAQSLGYLKPMIRSSVIENRGIRYDTTLRIAEDYDFILRLLARGARFRVYPQLLYFYRKHGQSISHRLSRRTLEPMLAAHDRSRAIADGGDRRLDTAMALRRASIQVALDFDDLVSAMKRRDLVGAAAIAMRRPRVAALLRGPLIDRLRRFGGRGPSPPDTSRRQVCVLSRQRIAGDTDESAVYLLSLCAALSQHGCDVHLLCPSPDPCGWPALLRRRAIRVFRSTRVRGSISLGQWLVATDPATAWRAIAEFPRRLGIMKNQPDGPALQAWTREDCLFIARHARSRADVVIADGAFMTDGIPYALRPDACSIVVMHDPRSNSPEQFNRADTVASIDRQDEMALLAKADVVVATWADEAAVVRHCLPGHHVITAPHAVTPVADPRPGRDRSILFVGSDTAPNTRGLCWFLVTIWPTVRTEVPDATLRVVGSVCATVTPVPDGVLLLGAVRDLDAIYREAAVVISPLLVGSGPNVRLIEALGHGKAVVATGVTVRGMTEDVRGVVAIADEPADFAAAVIGLLRVDGLRAARAGAALDLARTRFSAAACYAEVLALMPP